jgi:tRNA-splicing ligase RtcB
MSTDMQIFGTHDPQTLAQLTDVASRAVRVALMADGHVGFTMPIGGVAAYREQVSVVGVGFDIACGNAAIRTNLTADRLGKLEPLADEIADTISFGIGRSNRANDAPTDNALFDEDGWDAVPPKERKALRDKARAQLGTVWQWQPLRRCLRRRNRHGMGRRALRQPRIRPHDRQRFPRAIARQDLARARAGT